MKLTFAQNLPLRTYINSSNQILYQVSTPDNGYSHVAQSGTNSPTKRAEKLNSTTVTTGILEGPQIGIGPTPNLRESHKSY